MTPERIAELRAYWNEHGYNAPTAKRMIFECLDEIERLQSTIPITCDVCCEIVGPAKILHTADDLWMCERCLSNKSESPP